MQGGEVEHALVDVARGDDGELHADAVEEGRHVRDGELATSDRQRVDDGVRSEGRDKDIPLRLGGGAHEQTVDRARRLDLLGVLGGDELVSAELHSLLLLAVGAREDDDTAAHLGGVLDSKVAETANAHHTDGLSGLGVEFVKSVEDGSTTALERGSILVAKAVRDLEEESLAPDGVGGHGALVEVGKTVHLTLRAVSLVATQALLAVLAGVVLVTPADAVALLHVLDLRADGLNDTNTLVAETHVGVLVVKVGTAEAGGGDLDEDLIILEFRLLGGGGDNSAVLAALVDGE